MTQSPLQVEQILVLERIEAPLGFLSTQVPGRRTYRMAQAVALLSLLVFVVAVPFAKVPLAQVPAFVPIYESALIVNDLITAVLLFGQFAITRSRALLVLAGGYLFTATAASGHMLSFPGLFAPGGLLGAGPQRQHQPKRKLRAAPIRSDDVEDGDTQADNDWNIRGCSHIHEE